MLESKKRNEIGKQLKIGRLGTSTQIVHWGALQCRSAYLLRMDVSLRYCESLGVG